MRMILVVLYCVFSLLGLCPIMLRAKYLKKHGREADCERIVNKWVPRWMRHVLKVSGIQVQAAGLENLPQEGPVVLVCNHQSMLDVPVLLACIGRPQAMMSKAVIGKVPLLRQWMDLFDCLYVQRDDPSSARRCYEAAVRLVRSGKGICIFPEGTRSRDGGIGPFKSGSFRIASATGAPIVPMFIHGTRPLLEEHGGFVRSGKVVLKVFPPIAVAELGKEEKQALPARVHAMMDADMRALTGCAAPKENKAAAETPITTTENRSD